MKGEMSEDFELDGEPCGGQSFPRFFFNLAMIPMSKRLQDMGGLSHAIYADDVTIWTVLPSPYMGNTIKAEADTVKEEAAAIGLECAADKSALLIRTPRHGSSNNDMVFYLNLQTIDIPRATQVKVLGMEISTGNKQSDIIRKL